jgi:hypothetical protein
MPAARARVAGALTRRCSGSPHPRVGGPTPAIRVLAVWSGPARSANIVGMLETTTTAVSTLPRRPIPWPAGLDRLGREFAYLVAALPLGILTFTVAVSGLSLAVGLAITLLGIPVLFATLIASRWFATLERRRAGWLLNRRIPSPERPWGGGLWARSRAAATDPAAWRDTAWSLLLLPIGIATATIAITLWATALGFLTSPLWYWALPPSDGATIPLIDDTSVGYALLRAALGVVLLPVVALVCRGLATGTARLARMILG